MAGVQKELNKLSKSPLVEQHCAVLGIPTTANGDVITKAYRKKALIHHPDKEGGTQEKFEEIKAAYDSLSLQKKYEEMQSQASDLKLQLENLEKADFFDDIVF